MNKRKDYKKNSQGGESNSPKNNRNTKSNKSKEASKFKSNFKRKKLKARPKNIPEHFEEVKRITELDEIRLNKYIAESGHCSRRAADELIAEGVVRVNGKKVKELGMKIHPGADVTVNGDPISYYVKKIYIILNKPKDCVTTTSDDRGRKTIMDIVKIQKRVYPVGRLDRNTTGAILLTNDGELTNRMIHPRYRVEKVYSVGLDKALDKSHARQIADGVELEDGKTAPCFVWINPEKKSEVSVTITEGRYRQIRRLFEKFAYDVKKLDRKQFGTLVTNGLARGKWRFLNPKEIVMIKKSVDLI